MVLYPSLLGRLSSQHEAIGHIISGTDHKLLINEPAPGKWSAHDNIAHLACYQPVFSQRIQLIQEKEEPSFERYTADTDPEFESWRGRSTASLLESLQASREDLYGKITGFSAAALARTGIHPRYGRLNVVEWTEFFLLHEAHHIFTIFQLVKGK